MSRKLRAVIESVILEVLAESDKRHDAENLEANCKHCGEEVWLVWEKAAPAFKWTECGSPGEGPCEARFGVGQALDPDDDLEMEPAPSTMRSPSHAGISTKLKRSV
jgi:hypothetical protein